MSTNPAAEIDLRNSARERDYRKNLDGMTVTTTKIIQKEEKQKSSKHEK
jgi:hypothetical protein